MANKMKFILLFVFMSSSFNSFLFASDNDILTHYRLNGIQDIEKKLDKDLTGKGYWKNYLKHQDTKFGYLETYTNVLTCNKSQSDLRVYVKDANNTYILKKEYSAFTGKFKGDKSKEGDLKTPIGVYNLVKKLSKIDEFYGPLAFVTSYPNIYDKYNGKTGKGIWIHGLPEHQDRDEFTKGCIAIGNKNIECLNRDLDIKKTLLLINEKSDYKKATKEEIAQVLSELYAWKYAWKYNNLDDYLNFYSDKFIRFDGMNMKRFKRYKKRIFAKKEKKTILFKNLSVIPYPEHNGVYKITFDEAYRSNSFSFNGRKTLIIELINDKMNIITEK
ncbi:L,D-transpeptidase family protein [Sulfurimonas sp.]|uniref:L,D-transpeptidase family protein n=1 Tax=Sulfurimonas sp. TaxID=2022749 RepID=UPI00260E7C8F|nr:L,D-transpeptidase family protein [Sulfurimonas sp.]